jgi:hypothetical protein
VVGLDHGRVQIRNGTATGGDNRTWTFLCLSATKSGEAKRSLIKANGEGNLARIS